MEDDWNSQVELKEELKKKMQQEAERPIEDDFDNYMKKVGIVENLLHKLSSADPRVSNLAIKEAEELLVGKDGESINEDEIYIKSNKTSINQQAFDKFNENDDGPATMLPNEFMRQVEKDIKKREEDKKRRKLESDRHKKEGNAAFRDQRYAKALVCFDKAIDELRDSCILYCNRSLTYIKLGLPEKALKDAEMSLKVNEKSLRGFVYKAQALWQIGRESESRNVIEEACQLLPEQEEYLKGVLEEWQAIPEEEN